MDERVGAYIIDAEGNFAPDLKDEAMSARQNVGTRSIVSLRNETQKEPEVKSDA